MIGMRQLFIQSKYNQSVINYLSKIL